MSSTFDIHAVGNTDGTATIYMMSAVYSPEYPFLIFPTESYAIACQIAEAWHAGTLQGGNTSTMHTHPAIRMIDAHGTAPASPRVCATCGLASCWEDNEGGECPTSFYPECEQCGEPIDYCQGHGEIGGDGHACPCGSYYAASAAELAAHVATSDDDECEPIG